MKNIFTQPISRNETTFFWFKTRKFKAKGKLLQKQLLDWHAYMSTSQKYSLLSKFTYNFVPYEEITFKKVNHKLTWLFWFFFFCKTSSSWLQFILKFANKTNLTRYKNNFQVQFYIFLKPLTLMCYPQISLTLKQGLSVLDNFWYIPFNCVKNLCRYFIDWA